MRVDKLEDTRYQKRMGLVKWCFYERSRTLTGTKKQAVLENTWDHSVGQPYSKGKGRSFLVNTGKRKLMV